MDENQIIQEVVKEEKKVEKKLFFWTRDNYDKIFLAILAVAFILRIWIFMKTMNQPVWWDEADYLSTAKRWGGVTSNLIDAWYYRRGFFWPIFESVFFRLGWGENIIRFSTTIFSTGVIGASYFLIRNMFGKKSAILVSIMLALSWIEIFFAGRVLTDVPAAFFIIMATLFFWEGYALKKGNKFIYLFGLFFALACLTRMQYLMFAVPFILFAIVKEKHKFLFNKHLWIAVGIFSLIFVPQVIMYSNHFGNPVKDIASYYLNIGKPAGQAEAKSFTLYMNDIPYILDANNNGYSNLVAFSPIYVIFLFGFFLFSVNLILGLDQIFKNEELQKKFFILTWLASVLLLLSYLSHSVADVEQRYIIQSLPFFFLVVAYPYKMLENYLTKQFKVRKNLVFTIACLTIVILMLHNYNFGNQLIDSKLDSYSEVKNASIWIKENSNPTDLVISASLPQTTYYSERSTYPFDLAYRRDISGKNESEFMDFIKTEKPRYMILSVFEANEQWVMDFPQKHSDMLNPVQAYKQGEKPVLIIYEFKYK